jgi:hypothetical protein
VNVSVDFIPATIELGANDFAMPGGATAPTVNTAVAVFPVPPFADTTAPLTFVYVPPTGAVTSTVTTHALPPAIVPFENVIDPLPTAGVNDGSPHPVDTLALNGVATTIIPGVVGNTSLNATPVNATDAFGLVIVNASVDFIPATIEFGANDFAMLGGVTAPTVKAAAAAFPVPALAEVTALLVLAYVPPDAAVTSTFTVHTPPPASVPFENATDPLPAAGVKAGSPHPADTL